MVGLGFVVVVAYLLGLGYAMGHARSSLWTGMAMVPFVGLAVAAFGKKISSIEEDPRMTRIVLAGLVAKMIGTVVRYIVTFDLYEKADATAYHKAGIELSKLFRAGVFDLGDKALNGARFIEILTGIVYTIIGPTKIGGFLVFSFLSFIGLYLFYRAFRIGVPEGDHRRYALLVFFLPSMLYWPSSVGKEAWMALAIGLTAYGSAKLLSHRHGGLPWLVAGAVAAAAVRPHVALLLVGGLAVGYLFRRSQTPLGPFRKVAGLGVLLAVGVLAFSRTEKYIGLDGLSQSSVENLFAATEDQSGGGGSGFSTVKVTSPLDLPLATATVLFRPFPTEANNLQALAASAEGALLMGLFVVGYRRVLALPSIIRRRPFVTFAMVYSLGFIVAFSNIANFGILTRQRVQVLPLVVLILALPPRPRRGEDPGDATDSSRLTQSDTSALSELAE